MNDERRGDDRDGQPTSRLTAATETATETCPEGVPPEEVGAWAADGEPYGALDLAEHVPHCPACSRVVASVAGVDQLGRLLRNTAGMPRQEVLDRALERVRVERNAMLLLRTVGGAFARVLGALPGYATRSEQRDEDTAEWPVRPAEER